VALASGMEQQGCQRAGMQGEAAAKRAGSSGILGAWIGLELRKKELGRYRARYWHGTGCNTEAGEAGRYLGRKPKR
jgi:hypothetical protein